MFINLELLWAEAREWATAELLVKYNSEFEELRSKHFRSLRRREQVAHVRRLWSEQEDDRQAEGASQKA